MLTVTVPCAGSLPLVKVSGSPSTSKPTTLPLTGVSSGVLTLVLGAVGASLTGVTVTVTVEVAVPPLPSLTVTVKLSPPL